MQEASTLVEEQEEDAAVQQASAVRAGPLAPYLGSPLPRPVSRQPAPLAPHLDSPLAPYLDSLPLAPFLH